MVVAVELADIVAVSVQLLAAPVPGQTLNHFAFAYEVVVVWFLGTVAVCHGHEKVVVPVSGPYHALFLLVVAVNAVAVENLVNQKGHHHFHRPR